MTIHPVVIGIDVSKARLDIYDGAASSCANTPQAIAPLARLWAEQKALVVLEATGVYDAALRQTLHAAGALHARVNPGRARDFARAAGFLAKTDQVDARMLQAMGQALPLRPEPAPDPAREQVAALNRRRDQLVAMRQQERTRLKGGVAVEVAEDIAAHLAWLDQAVKAMDAKIAAAIAQSEPLKTERRLLASIPGIGAVAATVLISLMPELGARSGKEVAAMAGLAPLNRDSGQMRGRRTIGGGRKRVRDALYMAAVSASRSHSPLAERYRRLLQASKPPKLALIALARHILVTANAVIRDQRAYQP
jgi:transposase